jgi:hypothetical protein
MQKENTISVATPVDLSISGGIAKEGPYEPRLDILYSYSSLPSAGFVIAQV